MRIESSSLQFSAQHAQLHTQQRSERVDVHVGAIAAAPAVPEDALHLSEAAETRAGEDAGDDAAPPALRLLKQLIEQLTGREIRIFDASELGDDHRSDTGAAAAPSAVARSSAGWSLSYDLQQRVSESEQLEFSATGSVRTGDGRELHFEMKLMMAREYVEESALRLRAGEAARTKDPLVLNFDGSVASLSDQRIRFDLDADGSVEDIPFVSAGSGFLAFDRNRDGIVNDGNELFGARTGDGFAELAALDSDDNGWIDEADPAYVQLSVWRKLGGDPVLQSLHEADVGAIAVAAIKTPFSYRSVDNAALAELRATSVYLHESGQADTVQQLDFVV